MTNVTNDHQLKGLSNCRKYSTLFHLWDYIFVSEPVNFNIRFYQSQDNIVYY